MLKKYHYAFGCYGIIGNLSELVVIKKHGGPYTNRYDLPGGSLEDSESLNHAVLREVKEETGLDALTYNQIGVTSFKYPWNYQQWQYNQHICVFYEIKKVTGKIAREVEQFAGQDSLGAILVPLACLDIHNSSPLVLKAKEFLLNPLTFNLDDQIFKSWKVLDKPA